MEALARGTVEGYRLGADLQRHPPQGETDATNECDVTVTNEE
jgi:hypothetical protein